MKKKIICMLMVAMMLFTTACSSPNPDEEMDLQDEIPQVLANAEYENLEILFDEIQYYNGQDLEVCTLGWYPNEEYPQNKETIELYAEVVFPELMDAEELDISYITEAQGEEYGDVLDNIETYEYFPQLVYRNDETYSYITASSNWYSGAYISQGVIGKLMGNASPFTAKAYIVDEKVYDCRIDDLSDSYMLMDGEKTVAEARTELKAYFDEHYPFANRDNGIEHDIWRIAVGKLEGTEHYVYHGYHTFSYNGIPFTEARHNMGLGKYFAVLGESYMCESNKVDVTIGLINGYTQPQIIRKIETFISFQEVMDRVAYYLTGETRFQLTYGGLEYRLIRDMEKIEYTMIPSWTFVAKNPNDDTTIKIYVDMETGEIQSSSY